MNELSAFVAKINEVNQLALIWNLVVNSSYEFCKVKLNVVIKEEAKEFVSQELKNLVIEKEKDFTFKKSVLIKECQKFGILNIPDFTAPQICRMAV